MNSIRPFTRSNSVRERKGNLTVAPLHSAHRYRLSTGSGRHRCHAGSPSGWRRINRSSLHVRYHTLTLTLTLVSRGRVHNHVALQLNVVSASRLRAHTHAHARSHSGTVYSGTVNERAQHLCSRILTRQPSRHAYLSCRNKAPGSFPPRLPPPPGLPWRSRYPCIGHPPSRAGREAGLAFPPPSIMGNIGVRIFGRVNRSISYPWTSLRVPSLCLWSLR